MITIIQDHTVVYIVKEQVVYIDHNTKSNDAKVHFLDGNNITYHSVKDIRFSEK